MGNRLIASTAPFSAASSTATATATGTGWFNLPPLTGKDHAPDNLGERRTLDTYPRTWKQLKKELLRNNESLDENELSNDNDVISKIAKPPFVTFVPQNPAINDKHKMKMIGGLAFGGWGGRSVYQTSEVSKNTVPRIIYYTLAAGKHTNRPYILVEAELPSGAQARVNPASDLIETNTWIPRRFVEAASLDELVVPSVFSTVRWQTKTTTKLEQEVIGIGQKQTDITVFSEGYEKYKVTVRI